MSNIKKYFFSFFIFFTLIFIFLILVNCFFYFNLINEAIYRFLKIFIMMISVFISSYILGNKCKNKGYLNGLLFGFILISFMFLIGIFFNKLQIKLLFYYFIIISSSTLGGTCGIRKKKL